MELCSEAEHGSWEFWSDAKNKTMTEGNQMVEAIKELVRGGDIFPVEYESVRKQTYQPVRLNIRRLKNEIQWSIGSSNVDPKKFYWFAATHKGEKYDTSLRRHDRKLGQDNRVR